MALKCLIVDDEIPAQKVLSNMLTEFCPSVIIAGLASSSEEARKLLSIHEIDLIFLDVNMPKESGFALLNSIEKHKYTVVFVTGNQEYALKALKASAVDFLLKPVDISELQEAIKKVEIFKALRNQNIQLNKDYITSVNNLAENLIEQQAISRLTLHHLQGFKIISVTDIIYLEADGNYTIFHMQNSEKIVVSRGIREYEPLLDPDIYLRVHKSFIINLHYLKEYSTVDGYFALMKDGANIVVSRRRVDYFLDKVKQFSLR